MTGRARTVGQALALLAVASLLGLLVWKVVKGDGGGAAAALEHGGSPAAPAFALPRLDTAGDLSLESLRGKALVVNFWASWCIPCKAEAPVLERDWLRYKSRGVVFVGIDYHDLASDARTFVTAHDLTFPMLEDGSGDVTGSYGISQVPETYVVDANGKIVAHIAGPITGSDLGAEFRAALKAVS